MTSYIFQITARAKGRDLQGPLLRIDSPTGVLTEADCEKMLDRHKWAIVTDEAVDFSWRILGAEKL